MRRLFLGDAMAAPDGWQHLRTVLRIQTQVFDAKTGELHSEDDRYLISSLPKPRLTLQHWLLVVRRALISTSATDLVQPKPNPAERSQPKPRADAQTDPEIVRLRAEPERQGA